MRGDFGPESSEVGTGCGVDRLRVSFPGGNIRVAQVGSKMPCVVSATVNPEQVSKKCHVCAQ